MAHETSNSFDGLPAILREIAEAAGIEAAMALVADYGGTEVYLPHRPGPEHWLVVCVGRKAAEKICRHFAVNDADGRPVGNYRLTVPLAGTGVTAGARRRLIRELRGGATVVAAARKAGLHERTAWRYKAKLQDCDSPQGDLFGPPVIKSP